MKKKISSDALYVFFLSIVLLFTLFALPLRHLILDTLYLPDPYYQVGSYQKLADACALHQMITPDESTFPFDGDSTTYTVGLSSQSKIKWHKNVRSYHIRSGMESGSGRWWWCLDCSRNNGSKHPDGYHIKLYRDIPIHWGFDHDHRSSYHMLSEYHFHLWFTLDKYEYTIDLSVHETTDHFDETIGNELRPMVHSIIDQWYTEDGAVPGPDPL